MSDLTLTETADRLVYDCIVTGMQVTVFKDDENVSIRQCIPKAATSQTWQLIRDELAPKVKVTP